jgi:hypothetical protein
VRKIKSYSTWRAMESHGEDQELFTMKDVKGAKAFDL